MQFNSLQKIIITAFENHKTIKNKTPNNNIMKSINYFPLNCYIDKISHISLYSKRPIKRLYFYNIQTSLSSEQSKSQIRTTTTQRVHTSEFNKNKKNECINSME